jgi:D-mannonate dehydratase
MSDSTIKELEKIVEGFQKDADLDKFCQGIGSVAKRTNTDPMYLYMHVAHVMNFMRHDGKSYECEDSKSGKAKCYECINFLHEADTCGENSVIMPVFRIMHPEYKQPRFERATG